MSGNGGASVGPRHRTHSAHGGRAMVLGGLEETTLRVSRGTEGTGVDGRPAGCSVFIDRTAGG